MTKSKVALFAGVTLGFAICAPAASADDSIVGRNNNVVMGFTGFEFPFLNFFKQAGHGVTEDPNFPANFNADNYPSTGPLSSNIHYTLALPGDYCNYHWVIDWKGQLGSSRSTPGFRLSLGGPFPRYATFNSPSFPTSSRFSTTDSFLNLFGRDGAVEFKFNNCAAGLPGDPQNADNTQNATFSFVARASIADLGHMRLYRCMPAYPGFTPADPCAAAKALIDSNVGTGFDGWNPDFLAVMRELNAGWLRPMSWQRIELLNKLTNMSYAPPADSFTYGFYYSPVAWAGKIVCQHASSQYCDNDSYSVTLKGADSLTNGLTLQGYFEAGNNTPWPTLNVNGLGARPMLGMGGGNFGAANITRSSYGTFTRSSTAISFFTCQSVAPGMIAYDVTAAAIVGTVAGCSGNSAIRASAAFSTTSTGVRVSTCSRVSAGQTLYDLTLNKALGTVANCSGGWVTLGGANHPEHDSHGVSDALMTTTVFLRASARIDSARQNDLFIFGGTTATVAWFANATSIPVTSCNFVGANQALYDVSLDRQIGIVAGCSNNVLTLQAGAAAASAGDADLLTPQTPGLAQNRQFTLFYDTAFGAWLTDTNSPSLSTGVPYPVVIALANALDMNLWLSAPCYMADRKSWQEIARMAHSQLKPDLKLGVEFCNEVWNGSTAIQGYATRYGDTWLGLTYADGQGERAFTGLRSKQLFDAISSVWGPITSTSRLVPIMATQFWSGEPGTDEAMYTGAFLCGDSCGNSVYQANVGSDLNSSPNRPIDKTRAISGAPYFQGSVCSYVNFTPAAPFYDELVSAVDSYARGDTAAAFAFLQSDVKGGPYQANRHQHTVFYMNSPELGNVVWNRTRFSFNGYWEKVARDMTATAAWTRGAGAAGTEGAVNVMHYEGAMQCSAPRVAQCRQFAGSGKAGDAGTINSEAGSKYYCGQMPPLGYKAGDVVTYSGRGLTGFTYTIDTVDPNGAPLSGHISNPGRGGSGGISNQLLSYARGGGSTGKDLYADLAITAGQVTNVTLYSSLWQSMVIAWKRSPQFQALMSCAFKGTITPDYETCEPVGGGSKIPGMKSPLYPSMIGVAVDGPAGAGADNPFNLYIQSIYGPRYTNFSAFKKLK